MIHHPVSDSQLTSLTPYHLTTHSLPHPSRGQFRILPIALHRSMAEPCAVVGKLRQRVVRLAHHQKLTIIQSRYFAHPFSLSSEL
jgi:hypothetical protein